MNTSAAGRTIPFGNADDANRLRGGNSEAILSTQFLHHGHNWSQSERKVTVFSLSFNEESGKVVTSCRNHARAAPPARPRLRAFVFVDRYLEGQF